ncbi:MAG: hypothetical protein AAAC48_29410 [Phyllobacterium sp.]|jgi:hypothetical protein|uniref:hypothetical protein n=1 Tax=Phyllobacterium sp. TaxID=1871046 RepID=UPI0030F251B1
MATTDYREYEKIIPFEIKDGLLKLAKRSAQKSTQALLNAGRGNPNWIATAPREGGGFHAPNWSVRVSFANLTDDVYDDIGRAVRAVGRSYVDAFNASKKAK